jgi:hypothetical protein
MARKKPTKPGRPPRYAGKRLSKNRTFRLQPDLDQRLQEAAKASRCSVSEEIERRLEASFRIPDVAIATANTFLDELIRRGGQFRIIDDKAPDRQRP